MRSRFLAIAAALLALSCLDGGTAPQVPVPLSFRVVNGNNQTGLAGTELPIPLVVQVFSASAPVPDLVLSYRVSGGGSVFADATSTDANGRAKNWWTLGTNAAEPQRVEVRAVLANGTKVVAGTFTATALPLPTTLSSSDDSDVPDSLRVAYREDAALLALRHLIATGAPERSDVELPAALVESFYDALIQVYNARDLTARDSVVDLYAIHTFRNPDVLRITLALDSTAAWVRALQEAGVPTGNAQFDELVDTYDLVLESYRDFQTIYDLATLRAAAPLNTIALAPMFGDIEGVLTAGPNRWVGGGDDIRATATPDGWRLGYSYGFGDCLSGCIGRYTWTFRVFADGRVTYEGATGTRPPPPGQW